MLWIGLMVTLISCGKGGAPEPAPVETPVEVAAPDGAEEAASASAPKTDGPPAPPFQLQPMNEVLTQSGASPLALYEGCRERVEGPSTAGECSADSDCVKTGCSQELCVAASASELMSTCEILPCFSVLKECGCVEGICAWQIEDEPPGEDAPGAVSYTHLTLPTNREV